MLKVTSETCQIMTISHLTKHHWCLEEKAIICTLYPSKKPSLVPFFPSSLPSIMFFTSYCTVLYCTLLSTSGEFILQKLTCLESLTGRARLNPDTLLSLLRCCSQLLSLLRRFVESHLHAESSSHGCTTQKNEKTADESRNSSQKSSQYFCAGILDTWTLLKRTTALCCNTGQNNDDKKSIQIKNPSFFPLSHFLHQ